MPAVEVGSSGEKARRGPALGLLVVVAVALVACVVDARGPEKDDPAAWSWNAPVDPSMTVFVRNTNGSVEIKPATGKNVEVTADVRWRSGDPKRDLKFKAVTAGNTVTICALWDDSGCSPTGYQSVGHSGFVERLAKHKTDANVTFTVYVPTGVKIDALTMNGSIGIAATAPVKARTVNGTIKVATSVGPVDAETVNGSVDIRMTTLGGDGPVRARAITGSVAAYVPQKFDGSVEMESTLGSVVSDFPGTAATDGDKKFTATVGTGSRTVDIGTVTGSAALHKLKPDGTVASP
jgi:hypothetical protein